MKKIVSLILSVILLLSLSITAFATETNSITEAEGAASSDVTASYVAGNAGGTVYKVDITWENMDFEYHDVSNPVWDAENHVYLSEDAKPAHWEGKGTITITNHSNTNLAVTPSYTAKEGYENIWFTFSSKPLYVTTAETGNAETNYLYCQVSEYSQGVLTEGTENATIGTITVTIADYTIPDDITEILDEKKSTTLTEKAIYGVDNASEVEIGEEYRLNADYDAVVQAISNAETAISKYESGTITKAERDKAIIDALTKFDDVRQLYQRMN